MPDSDAIDPFKTLYDALYQDLVRIRLNWRIYRAFFATNRERLDLLNKVAPLPVAIIQDALYDSVILALCRASDHAGISDRINASVYRLCALAPTSLGASLKPLADSFRDACAPLRRQRDKYLAHSDNKARFAPDYTNGVSRRQIEDAIDAFRALIRHVGFETFDTDASSRMITQFATDEVALLRTIYHGHERIKEIEDQAKDLARQPADPRSAPPEVRLLRDLNEKPDWLNYRPPDTHD